MVNLASFLSPKSSVIVSLVIFSLVFPVPFPSYILLLHFMNNVFILRLFFVLPLVRPDSVPFISYQLIQQMYLSCVLLHRFT